MKKFWAIAATVLMLLTAACSNDPAGPKQPDNPEYPETVGSVTLTEAPTAVVSLSPGTTDTVYDLGYGSLRVGASEYCSHPAEALTLPKMGSIYQPDTEAVKAAGAVLVVCTAQPTESTLVELQQAGAQVLVLPRADSVEGIKQNYRALGLALGGNVTGAAAAQEVGSRIDERLAHAKGVLAGEAERPDATLLVAYPYRMATGDTLEGRLLEENGFHCSGAEYRNWQYPQEELKALETDVHI